MPVSSLQLLPYSSRITYYLSNYISTMFIANRSNITSLSLQEQWRQLILSLLSKLEGNLYKPYTLIINALDKYKNKNKI